MNIKEFRAKYPQYSDIDDDTLTTSLHQKHYSDIDFGEFKRQFTGDKDYRFAAGVSPEELQPVEGSTVVRPILEGTGAAIGSVAGTPAGPLGAVAGGTLGYGIGAQLADIYEEATGQKMPPQGLEEAARRTAGKLQEGALMEMGGQALGPAIGAVARGVGKAGAEVIGMATGAGPEAVKQAAKGSTLFRKAMRGDIGSEDIIDQAKTALQAVKRQRGDAITESLSKMSQNKQQLPKAPIKTEASKLMKKFNIRRTPDGELDFSRSTIDRNAEGDAKAIIEMVEDWGREADDFTPTGLHRLKMKLDDFYSESKNVRAIAQGLRSKTKQQITDTVPEYATMMRDYEKATRFINEAEKGLSLSDRAAMDTTLKKLLSTNRENFEFRREMLQQLERAAETELAPQLAGLSMQQFLPKGLIGKLAGAAGVAGTGISPGILAVAAGSSPRIAGEFLHNIVGIPKNQARRLLMSRKFQEFRNIVKAAGKAAPRTAIVQGEQNGEEN